MTAADKITEARALIEETEGHDPGPYRMGGPTGAGWSIISGGKHVGSAMGKANTGLFLAAPDLRDTVAALADLADAQAQENATLTTDLARAKSRGDNHWETLKGIRHIAKTSGDLDRIILWVDDAGSGYMDRPEASLAEVCDERNAARAEADALARRIAELEAALRLHKAWADSEDTGPDYGGQTRDTHPDGERIWRQWWDGNLDLCARAQAATDAALGDTP